MATDVDVPPGKHCYFTMWAIQHVNQRFRSLLNKRRSGRQNVPGAVRSIFAFGNPKPDSGVVDVHIAANLSGDFVCSMTQSEMKPGGMSARKRNESGSSDRVDPESCLAIRSFSRVTSDDFSSPIPARIKSSKCSQLHYVTGKSSGRNDSTIPIVVDEATSPSQPGTRDLVHYGKFFSAARFHRQ